MENRNREEQKRDDEEKKDEKKRGVGGISKGNEE